MLIRWRLFTIALLATLIAAAWCVLGPVRPAIAAPGSPASLGSPGSVGSPGSFVPPLPAPLTVLRGFDPPAQPWLPGNRGVDLAATTGEPVVAAADGVVRYAGLLAGRGVISVSHGDLRTTYEPVDAAVHVGDRVTQGQLIGRVSAAADGCGPPGGCLHWGALRGDTYIDPMSLLKTARIRLLPIWSDGLPLRPVPAPLDSAAARPDAPSGPTAAPALPSRPSSRPKGAATAAALSVGVGVGVSVSVTAAAAAVRLSRRLRRPAAAHAASPRKLAAR